MYLNHKVGDKVKIRKDLKANVDYGSTVAVGKMCTFSGKMATIIEVDSKYECYFIEEDDGYFCWTDEMFEDPITNADRIRRMTDEELAEFLTKTTLGAASSEIWMKWLTDDKWNRKN